jgi:hypothetical protein
MTTAEYPNPTAQSNLNRIQLAAAHIAQAKLELVRQSAETVSGSHGRGLRQTAERLQIFVELLDRLAKVEM